MKTRDELPTKPTAIFPMAPLLRFTLISLYLALVLPLPVLAPHELQVWLWGALPLGLIVILALVSEQVELSDSGIRVGHPAWCGWLLRRGWQLHWDAITALTPVATSQGGRVFYVRTESGSVFLLPQRVQALEDFLIRFPAHGYQHQLHRPDQPAMDLPTARNPLRCDADRGDLLDTHQSLNKP
jgi:hypothetical protein